MTTNVFEGRYDSGALKLREHRLNGAPHRLDGPAVEMFDESGLLRYCSWWQHGQHHRLDGPAQEWFHANGTLYARAWRIHGIFHRLDGPAFESFNESGKRIVAGYWFNGESVNEAEHRRRIVLARFATHTLDAGGVSL